MAVRVRSYRVQVPVRMSTGEDAAPLSQYMKVSYR
jgi:hypothetical protein